MTPEQAQQAEAMRDMVKSIYRTIDINAKDYGQASAGEAAAPKTDEAGFMSVPDGIDEELPFN